MSLRLARWGSWRHSPLADSRRRGLAAHGPPPKGARGTRTS